MNAATSFWALCSATARFPTREYSDAIASDIKLNVHTKSQGCSLAGDKAFFCRYVVNYLLQDESSAQPLSCVTPPSSVAA